MPLHPWFLLAGAIMNRVSIFTLSAVLLASVSFPACEVSENLHSLTNESDIAPTRRPLSSASPRVTRHQLRACSYSGADAESIELASAV